MQTKQSGNSTEQDKEISGCMSTFQTMLNQIEDKKMLVKKTVEDQLKAVNAEYNTLTAMHEELEKLTDEMKQAGPQLRTSIESHNMDLQLLNQKCNKKKEERNIASSAYEEKKKKWGELMQKMNKLKSNSDAIKTVEEASKKIKRQT